MTKTFSTKLSAKVLKSLDVFCQRYHLKKSHLLEEIITEGLERRAEMFSLAQSIRKGLEQEKAGDLHTAGDVENLVFHKKKAS